MNFINGISWQSSKRSSRRRLTLVVHLSHVEENKDGSITFPGFLQWWEVWRCESVGFQYGTPEENRDCFVHSGWRQHANAILSRDGRLVELNITTFEYDWSYIATSDRQLAGCLWSAPNSGRFLSRQKSPVILWSERHTIFHDVLEYVKLALISNHTKCHTHGKD